ncbi:MAG: L-seryl-tRNA(Sec) selenium transferase [Anaerolineae bacterium]|nr:L-seryl-tRNA(Sec) selenium transferase [Anaerolineae bacterium]
MISLPDNELQMRLRHLPGIDTVLAWAEIAPLVMEYGHDTVVTAIRKVISAERDAIRAQPGYVTDQSYIAAQIVIAVAALNAPTLVPVINATGIIIHTNLGRAPLSDAATSAVAAVGQDYATLEYDSATGQRGSRSVHAAGLLRQLTGAESATVVNNNAAAVLLMLTALCRGREVIISRGQLVEIGGGFRVPDVMAQSGARLVEVGTTNRTHLRDYEQAISADTAAIMVAHHSNFRIVGFTAEPSLAELAHLAHRHDILLLYDQGSGALLDSAEYGLEREPLVQSGIAAGCDIVAFSGDKLLGGPQAGILCGREALIETIKRHPLARAVRPDKLCLAALQATLESYARGRVVDEIPVWRMISISAEALAATVQTWCDELKANGVNAEPQAGSSVVGGGSLPGQSLPTTLVALPSYSAERLAALLRKRGIIGRIVADTVVLDPRTVLSTQIDPLLATVIDIIQNEFT